MQPIFEVTRAHDRLSNPWLGYLFSPNRFESERKRRNIVRGEYRKESIISRVRVLSLINMTPLMLLRHCLKELMEVLLIFLAKNVLSNVYIKCKQNNSTTKTMSFVFPIA
jgi:hypothetical protein